MLDSIGKVWAGAGLTSTNSPVKVPIKRTRIARLRFGISVDLFGGVVDGFAQTPSDIFFFGRLTGESEDPLAESSPAV
jgi:hypothetical protein